MTNLAVVVRPQDDDATRHVLISGDLDITNAAKLRELNMASLSSQGCRLISVDLQELEFMDSSGIGALIALRNQAAAEGLPLALTAVPLHIAHTLTVTGLADFFGLRKTS